MGASLSKFIESRNAWRVCQRPLTCAESIIQASVIFGEDSIGTGYRRKSKPFKSTLIDRLLPVARSDRSFNDKRVRLRFGNSLNHSSSASRVRSI